MNSTILRIRKPSGMGCHWRLARQCPGRLGALAGKPPVAPGSRPRATPWTRGRVLLIIAFAGLLPGRAGAEPPRAEVAQALRRKIDGLLADELTRCWYPRALDREHGGFHENFARDWSPSPDDGRSLVYQSRMTWTAAAFAAHSAPHNEEFIRYARHGVECLDTVMRDGPDGGFFWATASKDGEKHVYGTAFALYAASKAYAVTRDERALKVARDAFDWLERHAHDAEHGGYFEALARDGTPILSWPEGAPPAQRTDRLGIYYGYKSMNAHIHLLEALAEFSHVEPAPRAKERLREVHAIVRDKIAAEPGALNLYLTRDWRAIPAHDSFGHDVETAYLLVEAAEAQGMPDDAATWRMARLLVDHALDWGWDGESGGFFEKGEAFNGPAFDRTKVWWTQAEGLNSLLLMHRRFGARTDRYWRAFLKEWAFIERHLLDPTHGGWFMETTRSGELIGDGRKATPWKANYHTSRALMNVATMLREIGE